MSTCNVKNAVIEGLRKYLIGCQYDDHYFRPRVELHHLRTFYDAFVDSCAKAAIEAGAPMDTAIKTAADTIDGIWPILGFPPDSTVFFVNGCGDICDVDVLLFSVPPVTRYGDEYPLKGWYGMGNGIHVCRVYPGVFALVDFPSVVSVDISLEMFGERLYVG